MRSLALALATAFSLCGQSPDLYPRVRALVLEAEAASANMRFFNDNGDPHAWAGDILAHAGYLEEASLCKVVQPFVRSSGHPWRAWVLYGHREPGQKLIESATSAERKATYLGQVRLMCI